MSSKLFSRSGVFAWSPRGVDIKGLLVADFAQFYDPNAGSLEPKIDFLQKTRIFQEPLLTPDASASTNYRFNELSWSSMCSDAHPNGIVAGGTEDGTVVFFDAQKLVKENRVEILSARKDHHGHVLTIDVSRDGRWMASGGGAGQILLWDLANLKTPFSPGAPNFQDQVKMLRWNQKNESVFASISSRRVSCWDLRRNGSPVLEFAELPNCDWSSLSWHPSDASQLIVASQSQNAGSVIQKWDSRFTSTPVREYRHHQNGVTSVDWNRSDDRLLISSGCDGQVLIWNHETSEVVGGVGSLQNDWIRSVRWNEEEPAQFGIQYYQHPIQIGSLTALGTPQPGTEVLAARLSEQFVPAWHRAPLIGSSVSLGARLATFWKSYDPHTQTVTHNVEVETIAPTEDVGAAAIDQYLHVREDRRNLGWYLHERAFTSPTISTSPEDIELERSIWRTLLALQEGAGRTKMLQCLGLIEDQEESTTATTTNASTTVTTVTSNTATTTRSARSTSVISNGTTEAEIFETPIVERCAGVQWNLLDQSGWDVVAHSMRLEHLAVIRILMAAHQHVDAMMYAAQRDKEHLQMIVDDYHRVRADKSQYAPLMSIFSQTSGISHPENSGDEKIDEILKSFPDERWKELLGLIIANESATERIRSAAKYLGNRWLEGGKALRACIAFLIAFDVDGLLRANTMFPPSDRLEQALILHKITKKSSYSQGLEEFIITTANRLLTHGAAATAWNLVKCAQQASSEMLELQWTCWNVAGGKDCTGDSAPFNPYVEKKSYQQQPNYHQTYRQPPVNQYNPPPQAPPLFANGYQNQNHQNPQNPQNIAPMPPSSTFYQTPSWDHKPPPTMPSNMPPPKPAAPMTPGWNDPPAGMISARQTPPTLPKRNVMEVNWKPMDVAPAHGAIGAPNLNMNNLTIAPSLSPQATPTQAQAPPPIQLSLEDEKIMEPINNLLAQIIETARVQAKIQKAAELRARIHAELVPRLAANRVTPATKHHLMNMAYFLSMSQFREAQSAVSQMARNATDFVEISSFLPALKSLLTLATH